MKKKTIIILAVLAFFVISIAGVCYWQRENIKAVYYAICYTEEEQKELLKENEDIMKKLADKFTEEGISVLPDEAVQMLNEGELTEDDAIKIITGEKTFEEIKEEKENKTDTNNENNEDGTNQETNSNVANLVAKMYVLRSSYTGRLNSLIGQAKAEVASGKSKSAVAKKYIGIAAGLEGQCDAQVEGVLSQITAELKRTGGDLSLVSELRATYRSEKSVKKAAILSQFN